MGSRFPMEDRTSKRERSIVISRITDETVEGRVRGPVRSRCRRAERFSNRTFTIEHGTSLSSHENAMRSLGGAFCGHERNRDFGEYRDSGGAACCCAGDRRRPSSRGMLATREIDHAACERRRTLLSFPRLRYRFNERVGLRCKASRTGGGGNGAAQIKRRGARSHRIGGAESHQRRR